VDKWPPGMSPEFYRDMRNASAQDKRHDQVMTMLAEILMELRTIRQATEQANEPGPDDEPSPLQTLSG
jgi:hypothetical protein